MKLYYSPGSCSLSAHIVIREAALDVQLVKVDLKSHRTEDDQDFFTLNSKGYVPAVELDDGRILTEAPVVLQFLADLKPDMPLVPKPGTFQRYRVQEWLNFIATELHKTFSPLWHRPPDDVRAPILATLARRFTTVEQQLGTNHHLFGDDFTIADALLFAILRWARPTKVPLPATLQAFVDRVRARTAVAAAMEFEGLKL